MQFLDRTGVGTLWSICKEKFALTGHTHNYAGSGSPGGSANSAIGVVDYNETDRTIQIGYSGTGITGDKIRYIAGYTYGSGNVNAKIKDVSKDALKSWLDLGSYVLKSSAVADIGSSLDVNSGTQMLKVTKADGTVVYKGIAKASNKGDGIMSKEDKAKLDGIATDANNYSLPVASADTLGGIKAHTNYPVDGWPVCVNNNGLADTKIVGLAQNKIDTSIHSITVKDSAIYGSYQTTYESDGIQINNNNKIVELDFPSTSGTLAVTSDIPSIPDVSNLCRFNFVNSISDCVNGRINFLFKRSNDYVDLSYLTNLEEGTILLIYNPHSGFWITDKGATWYYKETMEAAGSTVFINRAVPVLAFFYNTYAYVCTFS